MKLKKWLVGFLSTAFVACLSIGFSGCSSFNKVKDKLGLSDGEGLEYRLNSDLLSWSVTGIGDCKDTDIVIPETYLALPVTSIGRLAFHECDELTSIVIPDSVTSIEKQAFYYCDNLTSVKMGNSVKKIGGTAFGHCENLREIILPDSLVSIGGYAFVGCDKLTSVIIPDSVETVGYYAFESCDNLKSVIIGNSVRSIEEGAFRDCPNLTGVKLPDSVETIGDEAFAGCDSLTFNEYGNANYLGSKHNDYFALIEVVNRNYSSYTIHGQTKVIASSAFYGCDNLTSIEIPDSVITIGDEAFLACFSLTNIMVDINNKNYKDIDGNLYSKDGTILIKYATGKTQTAFTIPDGVITIVEWAFENSDSLTSVEIPDSVTTIGFDAFANCDSLTSVVIGDGVKIIEYYAFANCDSLTSVVIGDSVETIGEAAFNQCPNLTSVYYKGTARDWAKIEIKYLIDELISATRYYYSENEPTGSGYYWHYGDNGEIVIWE